MIVTFVGHSSLCNCGDLSQNIKRVISEIMKFNENILFYCGGYGDFDNLCAGVCRSIRKNQPNCEVVFITPYISELQQEKMRYLIDAKLYDSIIYPPLENVPLRFAIIKRNEWIVNEADLIIAYVKQTYGGAYNTLEYARRKKKHIINLAE